MQFELESLSCKPKFIRPSLLLDPQIPKPLHRLTPRTILGARWWNETRRAAYKKNTYCCWACGINKGVAKYKSHLEAHERYHINYKRGWARLKEIVALCHSCHAFVHFGRTWILFKKGEEGMTASKYLSIAAHGHNVLSWIGETPRSTTLALLDPDYIIEDDPIEIAPWKEWRLIIGDKKYPSLFKDYEEWEKAYQ